MTDVSPIDRPVVGRIGGVRESAARSAARHETPAPINRGTDQVQLSEVARLLQKLRDLPEVREDLVSRVKAEIENGTYETEDKLDAALNELAGEIGLEQE